MHVDAFANEMKRSGSFPAEHSPFSRRRTRRCPPPIGGKILALWRHDGPRSSEMLIASRPSISSPRPNAKSSPPASSTAEPCIPAIVPPVSRQLSPLSALIQSAVPPCPVETASHGNTIVPSRSSNTDAIGICLGPWPRIIIFALLHVAPLSVEVRRIV